MTRECTSDGMRLYLAMESVVAPVEECGPTASKDGAVRQP